MILAMDTHVNRQLPADSGQVAPKLWSCRGCAKDLILARGAAALAKLTPFIVTSFCREASRSGMSIVTKVRDFDPGGRRQKRRDGRAVVRFAPRLINHVHNAEPVFEPARVWSD
jgi:hypothetical protein